MDYNSQLCQTFNTWLIVQYYYMYHVFLDLTEFEIQMSSFQVF